MVDGIDGDTGPAGPRAKPSRMEIRTKGLAGRTERVRREVSEDQVRDWMLAAARAAGGKTERPTVVLDVGDVLSITTWFIITSAGNSRLVKTIADTVEEAVDLADGPKPLRIEGLDSLDWVVMDYGDFVVHVFSDEAREYYELERLYRDAPVVRWEPEGQPEGRPGRG